MARGGSATTSTTTPRAAATAAGSSNGDGSDSKGTAAGWRGKPRLASIVESKLRGPYMPDMNAPLVPQVLHMNKHDYLLWVHTPHHLAEAARFFDSDFLEIFTRTVWWVVPLVWWPVALYLLSFGVLQRGVAPALIMFCVGMGTWSFTEYMLHRFLFHVDELLPDQPLFLFTHFLTHGVHHLIPMDRYRLVMPPLLVVPLIGLTWTLFRIPLFFLHWSMFYSFYGGLVFAYVLYDLVHYFSHHGWSVPRDSHMGKMKTYHMKHHFADKYHEGYGITTKFWDRVFGTMIKGLPDD